MKSFLKVAAVNFVLTGFLLAILVIGVPLAWDIRRAVATAPADARGSLAVYRDLPWAKKHFQEFSALKTEYHDFFVWRRAGFEGETITIDRSGYRRHGTADPAQSNVWLFGGSTMWGTGSPDDGTIAARLEKIGQRPTFNFGESGYNAHQSLNLLMKLQLDGGRPETIVFYDGVNDVEHKCQSQSSFYSTGREHQIRSILQANGVEALYIARVLQPLIEIAGRLGHHDGPGRPVYDCDVDERKAELVAQNLATDWATAKIIAGRLGARFVGVLQPVAFVGTPNLGQAPEVVGNDLLRRQYAVVYPRIRAALQRAGMEYIDLTAVFDGDEALYIDFCHVIPKGNEMVAAALDRALRAAP
jgi:hypothetical protein